MVLGLLGEEISLNAKDEELHQYRREYDFRPHTSELIPSPSLLIPPACYDKNGDARRKAQGYRIAAKYGTAFLRQDEVLDPV